MGAIRIGTSIPQSGKETSSRGSGPVTSYRLSPEELERYRNMPASHDSSGKRLKQPIKAHHELDPEEQSKRAKKRFESEAKEVGNQPSRNEFLRLRAAGKTHGEIESVLQLSKGVISSYWLQKWFLKGVTAERAREILAAEEAGELTLPPLPAETAVQETASPAKPADDSLVEIIGSLNIEIENLRAANALQEIQITDLHNDRDEWQRTARARGIELSEKATIIQQQEERIRHLLADLEAVNEPVVVNTYGEVMKAQRGITIHIPLLDTGEKDIEDRFKALVEYGGLKGKIGLREIKAPQLMAETFTRLLVIVNIIRAQIEDLVDPADIERTVQQFVSRHNDAHIQQLQVRAAENGWEVVG